MSARTHHPTAMAKRRLLVEGWRFLPHSYAMVNQWQLLALLRCNDVELRVRDLPLYRPGWRTGRGSMPEADERALEMLAAPEPGFAPDAVLRIAFPFDLSPSEAPRLAVFCTSEFGNVGAGDWRPPLDQMALQQRSDLRIVTPSAWSAAGLRRAGIPEALVTVVPHGVDARIFAPQPMSRASMRQRLGLPASALTFLNVGAMTDNKGIDVLLRAFARLCRARTDVYLLLKGADSLYRSQHRLGAVLGALGEAERQAIAPRIVYGGSTLSASDMAALYGAADVYVTPYRAEGFNLPALEAMACGLPVICTAGGPTDDFVADDCALRLPSRQVPVALGDGRPGVQFDIAVDVLERAMSRAAADGQWRQQAGSAARRRAAAWSWDAAVERLLGVLF